jgi:hypothetical protein
LKKIITAIGNPILNNKLQKLDSINVLCRDIQYKEGILEFLEDNIEIDIIVLLMELPGEIEVEKLIEDIFNKNKNIKIYIICENKNNNKLNFFNKKNLIILHKEKINLEKLINIINEKEIYINLKKEKEENFKKNNFIKKEKILKIKEKYFKKFKKLFFEFYRKVINIFKKIQNNILKYKVSDNKKIGNNVVKNEEIKNGKIITFYGTGKSGKSINVIVFSQCLVKRNKKVLIVDFDFLNKSIATILGIKKEEDEEEKKIKNNLYYLSGKKLLENNFERINLLKNKYDYIFIDNNILMICKNLKNIFIKSDLIFFLVEPNLIEIEKSKKLLEEIKNNYSLEKIEIILNKVMNTSTKDKIINEILLDKKIFGKIYFNEKYNLIINKNSNYFLKNYEDYEEIIKKI